MSWKDFTITIGVIGLVGFGLYRCDQSEWHQESERQRRADEKREATPHVIREADGCKVYAFRVDRTDHFFTSCPNAKVTTDRNYTVNCGKNCTRHESETNVTETK